MAEPQDIASQWKGLSPQQRDLAISRMTPEQKQKLATSLGFKGSSSSSASASKAPAPRKPSFNERLTAPVSPEFTKAHPVIGRMADLGGGAIRTIEDLFTNPKGVVSSMGEATMASGVTPYGVPINAPTGNQAIDETNQAVQGQAQESQLEQGKEAAKHPAYTAGNVVGGALVGEVLPKVAGLAPRAVEATTDAVRTVTGTGTKAVSDLVGKTQKVNAGIRQSNADAAIAHLDKTLDALHETKGNELQYQQAVKTAREAAQEAQRALEAEHSEAVQKAIQETREREDLHQQELRKAKTESEEAYQKKLADVQQKRAKAEQAHREEIRQYLAKKHKIQSDFAAAQERFKSDSAKQGKIAPTGTKLQKATGEIRARVETARAGALEVGNTKFNAVNEKLNPLPADMEAVNGLYHEVSESIGETQETPALLKRLGTALNGGTELVYKDLQPIYSELGKELSKGTLSGPTYHAYDLMHEGIGNEMQRIADSQGQGAQLTAARNYWRRMKQTFGKPLTMGDNATAAIKGANPDFLTEDAQANRIRLLGSFDSGLPGLFEHVKNLQKGAESLPAPVPEQARLKGLVDARKPIGPAPRRPDAIPNPEPVPPKGIAPPARAEIPNRPGEVQPELPKQPARAAQPDRPIEQPEKKLGTEDIQGAKAESLQKRAQWIRHYSARAAMYVTGYRSLIAVGRAMTGDVGALSQLPADIGEGVAVVAGGQGIAAFLENPKIVKMLTKATPADVEAIPPELRGDLAQIVSRAQTQGIEVSPALVRAVQGAAALAPRRHPTDEWANPQQ